MKRGAAYLFVDGQLTKVGEGVVPFAKHHQVAIAGAHVFACCVRLILTAERQQQREVEPLHGSGVSLSSFPSSPSVRTYSAPSGPCTTRSDEHTSELQSL